MFLVGGRSVLFYVFWQQQQKKPGQKNPWNNIRDILISSHSISGTLKQLLTAETEAHMYSPTPLTIHLPCLVDSIEYQFFSSFTM